MKQLAILALALPLTAQAAEKSLEERVEALEYASFTNTISWSGFFQSRYDHLTVKEDGKPDQNYNMHRLLGGLDFKATPNDKFSVFGRVSFGKFYNNENPSTTEGLSTLGGARRYGGDGTAYVERFFLNYTPINWLTLSVGRLPTVDGAPRHIYDGRAKLGSYPIQIYSATLDGYALTFTPKISDSQSLAIRYVLSPFSHIQPTGATSAELIRYEATTITGSTVENKSVRDMSAWMIDYQNSATGIARNLNLVYQGLGFKNFDINPGFKFSLTEHLLYGQLEDIASIGLTAYASYMTSIVESDGGLTVGVNPVTGAPIVVSTLSNKADGKETGSGIIAGLNYLLPIEGSSAPRIGLEYVKGDKNYMNFDFSSDEAFSYYGIRGTGGQVYVMQPLLPSLTLRVGYQQGRPDYTSGLIGEATKTDVKIDNIYANLRADF